MNACKICYGINIVSSNPPGKSTSPVATDVHSTDSSSLRSGIGMLINYSPRA